MSHYGLWAKNSKRELIEALTKVSSGHLKNKNGEIEEFIYRNKRFYILWMIENDDGSEMAYGGKKIFRKKYNQEWDVANGAFLEDMKKLIANGCAKI